MSDETQVPATETPAVPAVDAPITPPSTEEKIRLMEDWKKTVEKHIAEYSEEKEKEMVVWRRQKEMYDNWLSGRMKKIKKYDTFINGRKKVILEINREIEKLKSELPSSTPTS